MKLISLPSFSILFFILSPLQAEPRHADLAPIFSLANSYLLQAMQHEDVRRDPELKEMIESVHEALHDTPMYIDEGSQRCDINSQTTAYQAEYGFYRTIYFCRMQLNALSREYTAESMIHESIHAAGHFRVNGLDRDECKTTDFEIRIMKLGGGYPYENGYFKICKRRGYQDDFFDWVDMDLHSEHALTRKVIDGDLPNGDIILEARPFSGHFIPAALGVVVVRGPLRVNAINRRTANRPTALIQAVWSNRPNWVKVLLKHDADINLTDANFNTAVMIAAYVNNKEILETLLEFDSDLTLKNSDEKTALEIAREKNNPEIIRLIEEKTE